MITPVTIIKTFIYNGLRLSTSGRTSLDYSLEQFRKYLAQLTALIILFNVSTINSFVNFFQKSQKKRNHKFISIKY